MPDFAPLGTASVTDCVITAVDASNYATSDENGFEQADFSNYSVLEVIRPYDGAIARYNTAQADAAASDDVVLQSIVVPPSSSPLTQAIPESFAFVNGTYGIRVITAPTYDNTVTYNQGDIVYVNGVGLFVALVNSPGVGPASSADWSAITEAQIIANPGGAYSKAINTNTIALNCIVENTVLFDVTMVPTGDTASDIDANSSLSEVTFNDHSNYGYDDGGTWVGSDENGHERSSFTGYRKFIVTKPDDTTYILGTVDFDQLITAASTGNMAAVWALTEDIKDGLYDVALCSVPNWRADTYYNSLTASNPIVVYHNSKLWKALSANLNQEPATGSEYWEETSEIYLMSTRYCFETKYITTTRNLEPCKDKAVEMVMCRLQEDPCDMTMCGSKNYKKATDLIIALDRIKTAFANENWGAVDAAFNFAHKICCDGCDC